MSEADAVLAIDVGLWTLAMAQGIVHQVVRVLAPDCLPLFLTHGFKEYVTALVRHCGYWVLPDRQRAQGPAPKPRGMPLPRLLYAAAPEPTNGTGSAKQWRPCTPAMAAGLTNRVWTLREVCMFRVPPWPQPQALSWDGRAEAGDNYV